jgi:membrane protein implicated in regulation of membrane protease activity
MNPYFLIVLGFILMALEMTIGSAVLDFFILGIIFVISGVLGVYFQNELLAFFFIGLFSIAFLIIGRPLLAKRINQKITPSNSDALIGKEAAVKNWNNAEGEGQVILNHEVWLARGFGDFNSGDKVMIEKISGNTLVIKNK